MWIRIRAVIVEDDPLATQYLAELLDETCQVEVVGSATESEAALRLCAELRPDVVFVDINLPGKDGVSLATQLAMFPQQPRLVFTTGNVNRATDAFRLEAVDYLLKLLDPEQVTEAVYRLMAYLRPFEGGSARSSGDHATGVPTPDKMCSTSMANELLPVKDVDRDNPAARPARGCSGAATGTAHVGPYGAGRVCHLLSCGRSDAMARRPSFYPDRQACRSEPASHRTGYSLW
jgi:CheY-like chemotaxis protein